MSKKFIFASGIVVFFAAIVMTLPTKHWDFFQDNSNQNKPIAEKTIDEMSVKEIHDSAPKDFKIRHIKTPEITRGLYVTESVFSGITSLDNIIRVALNSGINSLIIDVVPDSQNLFIIKQNTGKALLEKLHTKNLYLIARVVVFKDDEKNTWYDPASQERWRLIAEVSKNAIDSGFDEINYDYIRYDSAKLANNKQERDARSQTILSFFKFLKQEVRDKFGIKISADIFGNTFINDELNIGQKLGDAVRYFDYIMPMPYPSHWADGSFGYEKPGLYPYEIVYKSLLDGWNKVKNDPERIAEFRSWIQDFNLLSSSPLKYVDYTPDMIYKQIKACYDAGCVGWALWDPNNRYNDTIDVMNLEKQYVPLNTAAPETN